MNEQQRFPDHVGSPLSLGAHHHQRAGVFWGSLNELWVVRQDAGLGLEASAQNIELNHLRLLQETGCANLSSPSLGSCIFISRTTPGQRIMIHAGSTILSIIIWGGQLNFWFNMCIGQMDHKNFKVRNSLWGHATVVMWHEMMEEEIALWWAAHSCSLQRRGEWRGLRFQTLLESPNSLIIMAGRELWWQQRASPWHELTIVLSYSLWKGTESFFALAGNKNGAETGGAHCCL